MRLNKLNFFILLITVFAVLIFYLFANFTFTSRETVKPIQTEYLTKTGAKASFSFAPERDKVAGVWVNFKRNFYLEDQVSKNLEFKIEYLDKKTGEAKKIIKNLPLSTIGGGNQKIYFSPLENVAGQNMTMTFTAFFDLSQPEALALNNQDYNPDVDINTAQRVIYQVSAKELASEFVSSFHKDRKFAIFYSTILGILALGVISLLILRFDQK